MSPGLPRPDWALLERGTDPRTYAYQEARVAGVLRPLEWGSALDLGAGFGRVSEVLREIRPRAALTLVDSEPAMCARARERLPGAEVVEASLPDGWDPGDRTWDLVVSADFLMHLPPDEAARTVGLALDHSRAWVLSVDWYEPGTPPPNDWNYSHDYPELYGGALVYSGTVGAETDPFWSRQSVFLARGQAV